MPTTVAAVLVLVLAVFPGKVGSFFFERLSARDWRERDWNAAVRLIGFSVLGLGAYALVAAAFKWPAPSHVIPGQYASLEAAGIAGLSLPYLGHIGGAIAVGLLAGLSMRVIAKMTGTSVHACAWDTFVADLTQDRWVVATLKSGDVYAGYVRVVDKGVGASERDLVLRAPAKYDPEAQQYFAIGYRDVFVPAALVDSIATVTTDDDHPDVPKPGTAVFQPTTNARQAEQPNTASSPGG